MNEKERIMQMVADGIITPDDAMRLLEYFETDSTPMSNMPVNNAPVGNAPTESVDTPSSTEQSAPQAESAPQAPPHESETYTPPTSPSVSASTNDSTANPVSSSSSKSDHIQLIDISWVSGPIEIRNYDGNEISITEYSRTPLEDEDKMCIYEEGEKLFVKWARNDSNAILSSISRLLRGSVSKSLVVEIPKRDTTNPISIKCSGVSSKITVSGFSADKLKIESTSGSIDLISLTANDIVASSVSGAMRVSGAIAGKLKANTTSASHSIEGASIGECRLESVSGSVKFSGATTDMKVNTVSGSVSLRVDNIAERIKIDTISGTQTIFLADENGFEVKYSSMSGKFTSEFPCTIKKDNGSREGKAGYGDERTKIKLGSMSGGLKVNRIEY